MTVYFGNVSHKPSKKNPAGTRRYVEGATDNSEFASIFGRSGRVNAVSSNAKLSVIDLYNAHSLFIDPQEMEQMSENQFLNQHTSMISNFRALGRYMLKNNRQEMQITLSKLVPAANITSQGDAVVVAVAKKLIGLGSDEEVKEATNSQTTDQAFRETIYRELKQEQRTFSYNVHGIDINVLVRLTGARLIKSSHTIKTTFKVIDGQSQVIGSASTYTRKADRKYKKQLQGFSKIVRNLSKQLSAGNTAVKLEFGHRYDDHLSAIDNAAQLKDISIGDFQEIQREIQKLFESVQPEEIGLDADEKFDDFNPASSIRRLWNDLGLASTDIPMNINEFDRNLLQKYANGALSAKEVFENSKDYFVPRFQNGLATRFSTKLVDPGALAEIMVDEHTDDWRGVDHDELISIGEECIEQAANQYAELLRTTTDLTELLTLYRASNKAHEDQIIAIAVPILIQREGDGLADSRSEAAKALEDQLNKTLVPIANDQWAKWLDDHHISRASTLNSHLNEVFVDAVTEEYLNELLLKADYRNNDGVTDIVKEFVTGKQSQIYNWYDQNYDYDQGLENVRTQLLDALEHDLPYRQVKDGYWKHIVSQLTDFTIATRYSLTGGIDDFISKYAPDWEDYRIDDQDIHEEAKQALHNRMNILLDEYLESKGISRGLYIDVNGDVDTLMGPAIDSNLSIIESLYPRVAEKMTIKDFVDSNLQSGNAISGFFEPGYHNVVKRIEEMFQTDKTNSRYQNYNPKVVFPVASAYGQGLITYDEYVEEVNPDAKKDSATSADQVFRTKVSGAMIKALSTAMETTGVNPATFALVGKSPSHLVDLEMNSPFIKDLHEKALEEGNGIIEDQITADWAGKYFIEDINEGLNAIKLQADQLLNSSQKLRDAARYANVSLHLPKGSEAQAAKYLERQLNDMDLVNKYFPQVAGLLNDDHKIVLSKSQFNDMLRKAVKDQVFLAMRQDHVALRAYTQVGVNEDSLVDQVMNSTLPDDLYSEGGTDIDSATLLIASKINLTWALNTFAKQLEKAKEDILHKAEDQLRSNHDIVEAFESVGRNLIVPSNLLYDASQFLVGTYTSKQFFNIINNNSDGSEPRMELNKDFKDQVEAAVIKALTTVMESTGISLKVFKMINLSVQTLADRERAEPFVAELRREVEKDPNNTDAIINSKITPEWAAHHFRKDLDLDLIHGFLQVSVLEKLTGDDPKLAKIFSSGEVSYDFSENFDKIAGDFLENKISKDEFIKRVFPEIAEMYFDKRMGDSEMIDRKQFNNLLRKAIYNSLETAMESTGIPFSLFSMVGKGINVLADRDLSEDFANELFVKASKKPEEAASIIKNQITSDWANKHFADDIDEAHIFINQRAEEMLGDNPKIRDAFYKANTEILVPRSHDTDAVNYVTSKIDQEAFIRKVFPNVANILYHKDDNALLERNEFDKKLTKAISTALYNAQEATGIAPNIYSAVDKGVTVLVDRVLHEDFANELFKQVQQQPENMDSLLKTVITPDWATKYFADDIDEGQIFIDQRAEEKMLNNPKVQKAFGKVGISSIIPRKNDKAAAQFMNGNLSEEDFIGLVFPNVARVLYNGQAMQEVVGKDNLFNLFEGGFYDTAMNIINEWLTALHVTRDEYKKVTGHDLDSEISRYSQKSAHELFSEVYYSSEDYRNQMLTDKTRANVLGRHAAEKGKDEIKDTFYGTLADIANDLPGDVTRTSVDTYVHNLLTERIESILSEPAGMDDLVTIGAKRGWAGLQDDIESTEVDEILEYAKSKNIKYIDDLKNDIGLMFSYSFLKQRLKPCIDEAVDWYADRIGDILSDEIKDFNKNQTLVKIKEAILKLPADAVAIEHGQISAAEFASKYNIA
ncbi:hypothetical protein LMB49_03865 [Limosilactobacillus reuteri]|uniref:hypothetical protein n=1 Tax=Limosilactobacillus reuteri TaxID=1598 RepID=UPI001E3C5C7A|nr:hypothetical protein [Limosilactobacillus reuteri]MCC4370534.1 hypothetical protein [Limosilactobacillus reuteri]MCC4509411.1 hypothetical protein [Limosilactobacillus reuteri]